MFTDSEILKKIVEEKEPILPEAVEVFAKTIPAKDIPVNYFAHNEKESIGENNVSTFLDFIFS